MTPPRPVVLLALAVAAALSLWGCARPDHRAAPSESSAPAALTTTATGGGQVPRPSTERAMRITIDLSLKVGDVPAAAAAVRAAVVKSQGYVGEANVSGDGDETVASFEAHVPVGGLPSFRAVVSSLGEVTSDVEKAEDVTEQRADLRARLKNARAGEKRLLDLLENKTSTLADVVAVEKELAGFRETIERMEAQERVLEGQIALATVRLRLSTDGGGDWSLHPGTRMARAARDGIRGAGGALVFAGVVILYTWPTVLTFGGIGYGIYRLLRFLGGRAKARRARRA